jgi:NSS family neurotransmitter:Na+ symporter
MATSRGAWKSRIGFIFAATGSAVGLGNVWRFPYSAGQNGGGAFVMVYLVAVLLVGLPIMVAELVMGWRTQKNPVGAVVSLSTKRFAFIGILGVISGFIILSYYSVVAGWALHYLWMTLQGTFWSIEPEKIPDLFGQLYANGGLVTFWHVVFMVFTIAIVMGGIEHGIERWSRILLPSFFILMLILIGFGIQGGGGGQAFNFLFRPKFGELTAKGMVDAVGQAFFSLSLGMGAMITYGSYLRRKDNVVGAGATISLIDTSVALLAGMMIFPIVFRFGQEPTGGPSLVFKALPFLFAQMPMGRFFAFAFFLLLIFAALTSAISLLEVVVAFLVDEFNWKRNVATLSSGGAIMVLGILSALSFLKVPLFNMPFLDFFDMLAVNYLLPIGGICISLFAAFVVKREEVKEAFETHNIHSFFFSAWLVLCRFVAPLLVLMVFVSKFLEQMKG